MNKIIIENDEIIEANLESVEYIFKIKQSLFEINEITLNVYEDSNLNIKLNFKEESKLILNINVYQNIKCNIFIITSGIKGKVQYKYNLEKNSNCKVEKLNYLKNMNEMTIMNLSAFSNVDYIFKSIVTNKESYDYMIYHKGINSISNIKNSSVNESGCISYQISSFIPKNITGCTANQFNRIINLTDNKCEIKPNLYIDCDDVEANHSALIDKFSDEEMFYIKSRGINEINAVKMLTRGFLLSNIENKEIIDLINKKYGGD